MIATGTRAFCPQVPGLAASGYFTNETIFSLQECPSRLAITGGGPIGCELAQALQRLGAQVTLIHKNAHLLDREDVDAAEILQTTLQNEGVEIVLEANIERVETTDAGKILYVQTLQNLSKKIEVDAILVAAG